MRLGLDLGGTKLLAALVDARGELVHVRRWATGRATTPAALERLLDEVRAWAGPVEGAGLGFPGLVDFDDGRVCSSVMLDGWVETPLAAIASDRLGVRVVVDNDVNAAALGEVEARRRAGLGVRSFAFVALGTGVGGAWVLDGRLFRGASGLAGELGHVAVGQSDALCECGRPGCLGGRVRGEHLRAGGERAERAVSVLSESLACALTLLDPGEVVLGGGVVGRSPELVARLAQATRARCMPIVAARTRFSRAWAGELSGALGAAALVEAKMTRQVAA